MKKLFINRMPVLLALCLFANMAFAQQKAKADKAGDEDQTSWNGHSPGTWDAVIKDGIVNIDFYGRGWENGRNFDVADFGALPMDKIGEFSLAREAGENDLQRRLSKSLGSWQLHLRTE